MSSKLPQQLSQLTEAVEQLQESVSPTDIKLLNQRCWLLQQQHSDLQHQLDIRFKITQFVIAVTYVAHENDKILKLSTSFFLFEKF